MPIYVYKNSKTGELIEDLRPMSERNEPLILEDGTVCERCFDEEQTIDEKKRIRRQYKGTRGHEGFEVDPSYYKALNPKYVKFKDGHREKYDPNKHC